MPCKYNRMGILCHCPFCGSSFSTDHDDDDEENDDADDDAGEITARSDISSVFTATECCTYTLA